MVGSGDCGGVGSGAVMFLFLASEGEDPLGVSGEGLGHVCCREQRYDLAAKKVSRTLRIEEFTFMQGGFAQQNCTEEGPAVRILELLERLQLPRAQRED